MTADKWVTIWCDADGCTEFTETGERTVPEARKWSEKAGWKYGRGRDLCPAHAIERRALHEGDEDEQD